MANKKSFVVYNDWGSTFDVLNDDQAGKLIKHLFDYVRGKNPEAPDPMTKAVFMQMKATIDRDGEKYDAYLEKQKANGKKGGRPRKTQKTQAFSEKPKKADSVSDSASVIESAIDILLEKETKEAFAEWIEYRKEIKKPIQSERSIKSLAKKFKEEGLERCKAAVELSIRNGWQGLFFDMISEKEASKHSAVSEKMKKYD